jgi:hypothetical protein
MLFGQNNIHAHVCVCVGGGGGGGVFDNHQ